MKRLSLVIFILSFAIVAASPTMAQTPDSTAARDALTDTNPETLGEQAAALLDDIRQNSDDYRAYQERMLSASLEDSLVLQIQIETQIDNFIVNLPKLANYYPRDPQTDGERDLQNRIDAIYAFTTQDIWKLIGNLRVQIDGLRAQRASTDPAGRGKLEYLITRMSQRLDILTRFGGEHLQTLESLGIEVPEHREHYRQLLTERADELRGRILLGTERMTGYQNELKNQAGNSDLVLLQLATRSSLDANTASMEQVVTLMNLAGLDTSAHRTFLLTITQDLASGLLDARATATLLHRMWDQTLNWITTNGPIYLVKVLIFLVIMFAGRMLAKLVRKAVDKSLGRARVNISQLLRRTLVSTAHNTILALALMIALSQLGLDLGPLLAGFGVIGFILGFAMQDSLSNFASGLMILFYRPYDVGDLVDISGVFGKVENMSLVSTSILTLDNQKLVVPNSKIWGDVIKNVTDQHVRRVDMVLASAIPMIFPTRSRCSPTF